MFSGQFCFDDDELLLAHGEETEDGLRYREAVAGKKLPSLERSRVKGFYEPTINSLKHRLLVFLFKQAQSAGAYDVRRSEKLLYSGVCTVRAGHAYSLIRMYRCKDSLSTLSPIDEYTRLKCLMQFRKNFVVLQNF